MTIYASSECGIAVVSIFIAWLSEFFLWNSRLTDALTKLPQAFWAGLLGRSSQSLLPMLGKNPSLHKQRPSSDPLQSIVVPFMPQVMFSLQWPQSAIMFGDLLIYE